MKKHWYDYLWIASLLYLLLGFFNILLPRNVPEARHQYQAVFTV